MEQGAGQGVGVRIKRLREEREWSMAKLAVEADMSVSGVSMIENGKRNLTTTTLAKLARAFGVEVADLFPKVEAPLWSDNVPRERRFYPFQYAAEGLDQLCNHWKQRLREEGLDYSGLKEFFVVSRYWEPMLQAALNAEIKQILQTTGLPMSDELLGKSDIWQAYNRYIDLGEKLAEAGNRWYDTELEEERLEAEKRREEIKRQTRAIA